MPDDPTVAERAVVVQLIERTGPIRAAELYASIRGGITPSEIDAAVHSLAETGVLCEDPANGIRASAALKHLDRLGLIAI